MDGLFGLEKGFSQCRSFEDRTSVFWFIQLSFLTLVACSDWLQFLLEVKRVLQGIAFSQLLSLLLLMEVVWPRHAFFVTNRSHFVSLIFSLTLRVWAFLCKSLQFALIDNRSLFLKRWISIDGPLYILFFCLLQRKQFPNLEIRASLSLPILFTVNSP